MHRAGVVCLVAVAGLTGCASTSTQRADPGASTAAHRSATTYPTPSPTPTSTPPPTAAAIPEAPSADPVTDVGEARRPLAGDGHVADATLSIPALGLTDLTVRAYRGETDDDAGTVIQDRGDAASPYGPRGGVGPGGVGNFQVTGHRTSSTAPFADLPALADGDRVEVVSDGVRYTYRIVDTRRTSFRSVRSLAEQRAAVPGHPGRTPRRAMITLSTCATPEDHAAGNWWADENGDPEHRIDKIGVLVRLEPVDAAG